MEEKLVRICWNTNNWIKPSGSIGKSKNKDAYEDLVGYGHEEWLFDFTKIIDDYHYAFLQAANSGRNAHKDKSFNIHLYSINSDKNTRWWIGTIKNVIMVDENESIGVFHKYKELGWLSSMADQLTAVNANAQDFIATDPKFFSTIKFKPSDLIIESPPKQFSKDDKAIKATYYNFQPFDRKPDFIVEKFKFTPGHNTTKEASQTIYSDHGYSKDLLHNRMQNSIYLQLIKKHGDSNVGTEQSTGNGTRIDIVVKNNKDSSFTFYEIKTSPSLLGCIREGLSQLLEYAFYPDNTYASKLIIISQNPMTDDVKIYLSHIRNKFGVPVFYQHYDIEKNTLSSDLY